MRHPIYKPCQHTLSVHSISTLDQYIVQHALSTRAFFLRKYPFITSVNPIINCTTNPSFHNHYNYPSYTSALLTQTLWTLAALGIVRGVWPHDKDNNSGGGAGSGSGGGAGGGGDVGVDSGSLVVDGGNTSASLPEASPPPTCLEHLTVMSFLTTLTALWDDDRVQHPLTKIQDCERKLSALRLWWLYQESHDNTNNDTIHNTTPNASHDRKQNMNQKHFTGENTGISLTEQDDTDSLALGLVRSQLARESIPTRRVLQTTVVLREMVWEMRALMVAAAQVMNGMIAMTDFMLRTKYLRP